MTSFEEAQKEYRDTYGVNPPTAYANHISRDSRYGLVRFEYFLRATEMPTEAVDKCSRIIHGCFDDYDFLIEHLKLLEVDMIAVLIYLVSALRGEKARTYIKQFTTLKRGHQLAFVNSMAREPGVKKTALLLDSFFSDPEQHELSSMVPLWVERHLSWCELPALVVTVEDHESMESIEERKRRLENEEKKRREDAEFEARLRQRRQMQASQHQHQHQHRDHRAVLAATLPHLGYKSTYLQDDPFHDMLRRGPIEVPPEPVVVLPDVPPPAFTAPPFLPVKCLPEGPFGPEVMLLPGTVTRYGVVMFDGSIRPVPNEPVRAPPPPLLSFSPPVPLQTPAELPPTETHPMRPRPTPKSVPPANDTTRPSTKDLMASAKEQLTPFSLEETIIQPPVIQEESSIERVLYNLKVRYPPLATVWPSNTLPEEQSFPSPEDAINYAMSHAYYCHYQVVPRFLNNTTLLQCSRMQKDDEDNGDEEDMTNRKSCNFALRIDYDDESSGEYHLRHIAERSFHNHPPNIHPSSLKDNHHFEHLLDVPNYASEIAMLDTLKRDPDKDLLKEARKRYPEESFSRGKIDKMLYDTQQARLEGGTPLQALYKLFGSPLIRARCRSSNPDARPDTIFFAHTQGYRLWRAYPEVVLIDASQGREVDGKYYRLVLIKGINCHDLSFPIAACLVEKTSARDPIDVDSWRWTINEFKEMQTDYDIAAPHFIQSSCNLESISVCEQVFPGAHVYMDPIAADKLARQTAQTFITTQGAIDSALRVWNQVITRDSDHSSEQMLDDIINRGKCFPGLEQFLGEMRKYRLKMSVPLKQEHLHFNVQPNTHYEDWGKLRTKFDNVFEMVLWLLHEIANCYEKRCADSGLEYVQTWSSLGTPFKECVHVISYKALQRVQELMYRLAVNPNCGIHCFENGAFGYPCVHGLQSIIQTRNLAPDDFHPHWRNLYADLTEVRISGQGRFAEQWRALKCGPDVYASDYVEVFTKPKILRENLEEDKENQPPKRHKSNRQGSSKQPIEL